MITFSTASGSEYEIVSHPSGKMIRRVNSEHEKRADDKWVRLVNNPEITVGGRVLLVLDSLASYGGDDHGTAPEEVGPYTYRRTTEIVRIGNAL